MRCGDNSPYLRVWLISIPAPVCVHLGTLTWMSADLSRGVSRSLTGCLLSAGDGARAAARPRSRHARRGRCRAARRGTAGSGRRRRLYASATAQRR
jgi:hypothetical protein